LDGQNVWSMMCCISVDFCVEW